LNTLLTSRQATQIITKSSSEDEIANVNFLYDDIVHVLKNTIDTRTNFATDMAYHSVYCKPEAKHHIKESNGKAKLKR